MEELFQQCAGQGIVTREQLATMEPYFQSHNMPNNRERELLLQMLLQADRPSSLDGRHFRKETLRLLLNYLLEEPSFTELDFARYIVNYAWEILQLLKTLHGFKLLAISHIKKVI